MILPGTCVTLNDVRVLIAPDCFSGTLTATQAARAIADGWARSAPHDHLDLLPLSDGGPGFVDVIQAARGGEEVVVDVSDPLGRQVPAAVLVIEEAGERTVYVEAASACGLHLLAADERKPGVTSTYGVGELLEAALEQQPGRIVVGIGGSGTNDAGAGMLAALGAGPVEELARGGLELVRASDRALGGLAGARARFADIDLVVASDVDNPLLGLKGASAVYSPQKGADPATAQALEAALGRFTEVVARALPRQLDLLTGQPRRLDREAGAGAAGGLGYALSLLGARRVSGVGAVLDAVDFAERIVGADLVITGEGSFDWQSLRGKVVAGVSERAAAATIPVVVIAGQVLVGRRETMSLGVSGSYAVARVPTEVAEAMADPVGTLSARAARVARTWSPRPGDPQDGVS